MGGSTWADDEGWLESNVPCTWYGVSCVNGHVSSLLLDGNGLSRAVPSQIGDLAALEHVHLDHNRLSGGIPAEIGDLAGLQSLDLSWNQLGGALPLSLADLSQLQTLRYEGNQLCEPTESTFLSWLSALPPSTTGRTYVPCTVDTPVEPAAPTTLDMPYEWGQVVIPAGAITTTATLTYTEQTVPDDRVGGLAFANRAFTLDMIDDQGTPITAFTAAFTITLRYEDSDWQAAGIADETSLNLYYWDGDIWAPVLPCAGCTLDVVGNVITARLDHLTEFALVGRTTRIYLPLITRLRTR